MSEIRNDVTEDEAAEKWCPHVRNTYSSDAPSGYAPTHNRFGGAAEEREEHNCIGSRCMAWRWTDGRDGRFSSRGYCGLAK